MRPWPGSAKRSSVNSPRRARWEVIPLERDDRALRPLPARKLLRFPSSATFFEGYDNFVLSFVLALVLVDLGGTEAQAGGSIWAAIRGTRRRRR